MNNFLYVKVKNTDELLRCLDERKGCVWAGGTDLMLKLKHGIARPAAVFDISCVKELCGIAFDGECLRIGSCVKLAEVVKSRLIKERAPMLVRFAEEIGSMEVRNIGTIGGNICASRANCGVCFLPGCRAMTGDRSVHPCRNASYADMLLPLVAYGASVVIKSYTGERCVEVKDFLKSNGAIDLTANEVITEVLLRETGKENFGVAELRQPLKMGFPYISVIAKQCGNGYSLTIGGSTKKIYYFEHICKNSVIRLCGEVEFADTLKLSKEYRRKVLPSVIQCAVNEIGQG